MGSEALRVVQYGLETTHGTNVAADTQLLMVARLPDTDREVVIPQAQMGVRTNRLLDSAFTRRVLADGITLESVEDGMYFEALPLIFSMGLKASTGTVVTTGQSDYLWTFAAPQTGAETVASITLEVGDDAQGYEIGYCLARRITLSGDCDSGLVSCTVDLFGDRILQTTLTTSVAVPTTAELMTAKLSQIFVDDTWAGLGGTELELALVNWQVVIETGVHPKMLGSTSREFDSHGQNEIQATATFTLERTAAVIAEELLYRPAAAYAVTPRFARLKVTGNQIGTGTYQTLQIDMAGAWMQWTPLGTEREGNTLDVAVLQGGYDVTGAQGLSVSVTTRTASI